MPTYVSLPHALVLIELSGGGETEPDGTVEDGAIRRQFFARQFEGRLTIEGICDGVWSTVPNKWDSLYLRYGQCEFIEFGERRWTDLRVDRQQLVANWPQLWALSTDRWCEDKPVDGSASPSVWHCLHCFAFIHPTESCPRCGLMLTVEGKDYEVDRDEGGWEAITLQEILAPPHQSRFAPGYSPPSSENVSDTIALDPIAANSEEGNRKIVDIPKKKGRPQKYDWDAAYIEVIRLANGLNGLPETQAELVRHLQEWFHSVFGQEPSESVIQQRVREIYQITGPQK